MDSSTLQHFTTNSAANDSNNLYKVCQAGPASSNDTTLQFDDGSIIGSLFSHPCRSIPKWDGSYGMISQLVGSSLDIGLGPSSSSFESSISMECMNCSPHVQHEKPPCPKKSCSVPSLKLFGKTIDLELSSSVGPTESDVTSITPCSCVTPAVAGTVQLVDEGSTSSRWNFISMAPPLQSPHDTQTALTAFDHVFSNINPTPYNLSMSPRNSVASKRSPTGLRTCQVEGCEKGARGASGRCIAHGGGPRCQKSGCQKGAEGKTVFCKAHGGGRRCQHLGCTKSAEGRTDFCIAHGGGKRCTYDGCSRAARGKSGLCIRHGGGKRCKVHNCKRSAEGILGLCISHGGGRRCQHPACTKGAQGSTMFCKAHGGGKRCTAPSCTKGAEGSTPFCKGHGGGKRCTFQGSKVCPRSVHGGTLFCVAHGGGKRCAVPECTKSARGRTAYCVRHGGGKRCKHLGCGKSAQGSTDFCKAHGGGKRCSWGQVGGLEFGDQATPPCDKFARGKTGLCAAHSTCVHDKHSKEGGGILCPSPPSQNPKSGALEKMKEPIVDENNCADGVKFLVRKNLVDLNSSELMEDGHPLDNFVEVNIESPVQFSLPEGRVHGGGLMAMLRSSVELGSSTKFPSGA